MSRTGWFTGSSGDVKVDDRAVAQKKLDAEKEANKRKLQAELEVHRRKLTELERYFSQQAPAPKAIKAAQIPTPSRPVKGKAWFVNLNTPVPQEAPRVKTVLTAGTVIQDPSLTKWVKVKDAKGKTTWQADGKFIPPGEVTTRVRELHGTTWKTKTATGEAWTIPVGSQKAPLNAPKPLKEHFDDELLRTVKNSKKGVSFEVPSFESEELTKKLSLRSDQENDHVVTHDGESLPWEALFDENVSPKAVAAADVKHDVKAAAANLDVKAVVQQEVNARQPTTEEVLARLAAKKLLLNPPKPAPRVVLGPHLDSVGIQKQSLKTRQALQKNQALSEVLVATISELNQANRSLTKLLAQAAAYKKVDANDSKVDAKAGNPPIEAEIKAEKAVKETLSHATLRIVHRLQKMFQTMETLEGNPKTFASDVQLLNKSVTEQVKLLEQLQVLAKTPNLSKVLKDGQAQLDNAKLVVLGKNLSVFAEAAAKEKAKAAPVTVSVAVQTVEPPKPGK